MIIVRPSRALHASFVIRDTLLASPHPRLLQVWGFSTCFSSPYIVANSVVVAVPPPGMDESSNPAALLRCLCFRGCRGRNRGPDALVNAQHSYIRVRDAVVFGYVRYVFDRAVDICALLGLGTRVDQLPTEKAGKEES